MTDRQPSTLDAGLLWPAEPNYFQGDAMTTDRLAEIREREQQATPGPWKWDGRHSLEGPGYQDVYYVTHDHGCACRRLCQMEVDASDADLAFIAASREDIPYLLARVAELERLLEAKERVLMRFARDHVRSGW